MGSPFGAALFFCHPSARMPAGIIGQQPILSDQCNGIAYDQSVLLH